MFGVIFVKRFATNPTGQLQHLRAAVIVAKQKRGGQW
jgi:hypothetical protein